jgi:hypothetical protein
MAMAGVPMAVLVDRFRSVRVRGAVSRRMRMRVSFDRASIDLVRAGLRAAACLTHKS